MRRLDEAPEVADLACDLGLGRTSQPAEAIVRFCCGRIARWLADAPGVTTVNQLEDLVTRKLQMVFEEIRSDADFDRITQQYARAKKDPVFASMRFRFDDASNPTYGALVMRRNVAADAPDRFVAVIDCRGSKLARRFFTRWHEIAHRLTTHADEGDREPAYRSEQDPVERMMDEIAGQVGFYGPVFEPVFQAAHGGQAVLTFGTVEAVRSGAFPDASFQATLNACVRRMATPVLYLEAALAHKKEVRRKLATPSLFGEPPPPGELRAVKVVANDAAHREGFLIPPNMRVPAGSVIRTLFEGTEEGDASAREDLALWESQGRRLTDRAVVTEARKLGNWMIALIQPLNPVRATPSRTGAKMLFSE